MRNAGKDLWRLGQGEYRRTYLSRRADLLPGSPELEPGTNVEWAEFFDVKDPFDLRGTMFLLYRYTDPAQEDDTWADIPSLRRPRGGGGGGGGVVVGGGGGGGGPPPVPGRRRAPAEGTPLQPQEDLVRQGDAVALLRDRLRSRGQGVQDPCPHRPL